MLKKHLLAFLTAAALILPSFTATAQTTIGLGTHFAWDNYKTALYSYSASEVVPDMTSVDYASPRFGGSLLLGLLEQRRVLNLDLDFGFFSHTIFPLDFDSNGAPNANNYSTKVNFFKLGVALGAKFHFKPPEVGKAGAYVFVDVGKVFA